MPSALCQSFVWYGLLLHNRMLLIAVWCPLFYLFVDVQTSQSAYSNASDQLTAMQLDRDNQILAVQETNRVKQKCCLLECLQTIMDVLFSAVMFMFCFFVPAC